MRICAIIASGGIGRRMSSSSKKQFLKIAGKPLLAHSIYPFQESGIIDEIIVVCPSQDKARTKKEIVEAHKYSKVVQIVAGGQQRQDSVYEGLLALKKKPDIVFIHDGVRPFVKKDEILRVVEEVKKSGAAIFAFPVRNTIKEVDKSLRIHITLARDKLWEACTPQVFYYQDILKAHQKAKEDRYYATDDAALLERTGKEVAIFPCSCANIKITHPVDIKIAEAILKEWSY